MIDQLARTKTKPSMTELAGAAQTGLNSLPGLNTHCLNSARCGIQIWEMAEIGKVAGFQPYMQVAVNV